MLGIVVIVKQPENHYNFEFRLIVNLNGLSAGQADSSLEPIKIVISFISAGQSQH